MMLTDLFRTVVLFCVVVSHLVYSQTGRGNVPNSPMWPIFSQLLSAQTGRTLQDINVLGLSDPTINQLWTSYSATLAKMSQTPAPKPTTTTTTTTPPPLPDLYQTSYSFSSSNQGSGGQAANPGTSRQTSSGKSANPMARTANAAVVDSTVLYKDIVNLINQLSGGGSSNTASQTPTKTVTSSQDVLNAYALLAGTSNSGSSGSSNSSPNKTLMDQLTASVGSSTSAGGTNYQALVQKYIASTGGAANSPAQTSSSKSSAPTSYQALVDQYNAIVKQSSSGSASSGNTGSYETLLQQYNQIMGGKASGTGTSGSSGAANEKLLQMYAQMMNGKTTDSKSTTPAPSPGSPQETFDKQLSSFFPQFKNLFPQSSAGNTSKASSGGSASAASSDPASSSKTQMIFDALLFAPPQPAAVSSTVKPSTATQQTSSPAPPAVKQSNSALSFVQNMVNSGAKSDAILTDHLQNVFKTRASREMGCRFLPELLELDVLATAPVNCMNRCPFPYMNSQQYGIYCVCCPPGVNEQAVGMMSLVRGTSYMETPLTVVS